MKVTGYKILRGLFIVFEDFFLEKENRKYIKYENSSELKKVFQFLDKVHIIV